MKNVRASADASVAASAQPPGAPCAARGARDDGVYTGVGGCGPHAGSVAHSGLSVGKSCW